MIYDSGRLRRVEIVSLTVWRFREQIARSKKTPALQAIATLVNYVCKSFNKLNLVPTAVPFKVMTLPVLQLCLVQVWSASSLSWPPVENKCYQITMLYNFSNPYILAPEVRLI